MKTKKILNALVLVVLCVATSLCATACGSKKYTVTLDANGGVIADDQTTVPVTLNKNYTLPTPTRPGFTFEGWLQAETSVIPTTGKWTIEGDVALKASWKDRIYNITLDANGGEGLTETVVTVGWNGLLAPPTLTKSGYVFAGWALNDDVFAPNSVITWTYDNDATLVAKWTAPTTQVTISANGGQGLVDAVVTATKGEVLNLPTLTKTGYSFAGWELNEQPYDATVAWNLDAPTATLVAQWTANTYTITIDVNGGNALSDNTVDVVFKEVIVLPSVSKSGSQIDKWVLSGTQTEVDVTKPWSIAENVTLVAQWKSAETLVTFDVNGGVELEEGSETATFTFGEKVTLPTTTKVGYNLVGYKCGDTVYTAESFWDIDASTATLVAEWEGKTIPVTFNTKGGTAVNGTNFTFGQAPYAEASLVPTTTKNHCEFDGWLYNGEKVDLTSAWNYDAESIELVAKWEGTETTVTVKYGVSGIEDKEEVILYGDVFDFAYDRTGYVLNNFVIEGTTTEVAVSGNEWAYTEDKTIVAVWTAKTFNLTIKGDDGEDLTTSAIVVTYDQIVDLSKYVPKNDWKFVNGEQVFFEGFKVEGTDDVISTGSFDTLVWKYDSEVQDLTLVVSYGSNEIWI